MALFGWFIFGLSMKGSLFGTPFKFEYSYIQGEIRTYDLDQSIKVLFDSNGQKSSQDISLIGKYVEKIYDVNESSILLGISLKNVQFNTNFDIKSDPRFKDLLTKLENEIYVEIDTDRKVKQFYLLNEEDIEASNFTKNIFLSTQLILSKTEDSAQYTKQSFENNMSGPYESHYYFKNFHGHQFEIEKTLVRYGIDEDGNLDDSADIKVQPSSKSKYRLDIKKGLIKNIDYSEKTIIQSFGMQINNEIKIKLKLNSISNDPQVKLSLKDMETKDYFKSEVQGGEVSPKKLREILKKRVEGKNLEDLILELRSLNFAEEGQRAYQLFRMLSAMLQLYPEKIQDVLSEIESLDSKDEKFSDFIAIAFGAISTMKAKDAQGPLMDFINANIENVTLMEQAFASFGDLEAPDKVGKEFLETILEKPINREIESLASLALGTLGKMATEDDNKDLHTQTANTLIERLENNKNLMTTLSSLGNLGSNLAVEKVKPLLKSEDATIRMGAVGAFDHVDPKISRPIILDVLQNEKEFDVRQSAYDVMGQWPPSKNKLDMAKSLFEKENDPRLKVKALNVLAQNSKFFKEEIKEYLEKVKSSGSDQTVKDAATDLMLSF